MNAPPLAWLDGLARRISGWLLPWGDDAPALLTVPVLAATIYLATVLLLRRVVPWLTSEAVEPAAIGLLGLAGIILLAGQAVLALPWRAVERRPPGVLYGLGDTILTVTIWLQRRGRDLAAALRRLRQLPGAVVLVLTIGMIWTWNDGYCERQPGPACQRPVAAWTRAVQELRSTTRP